MLRKITHYVSRPKLFGINYKRNWGDDEEETQRQESTQTQTQTRQNYPESDLARQQWGSRLTEWGQPGAGYGANLPDLQAIFENAKRKINQHYWGSPTGPGVIDKIKSSVSQRGVQDSPALGVLTSRLGAEEAGKIGDISVGIDTEKANAIERARGKWLSSLMDLANLSPQSTTSTGRSATTMFQPATSAMDVLGTLLGAGTQLATSYFTGKGIGSGLSSILDLANINKAEPNYLSNPFGGSYGR